jgi:glycopeptide antibiotics resistance protein
VSVDHARDGSPGRRVAIGLAAGLAAGLAVVLLWPDGEAVRQAVLRVYVFFLHRGMPASVTPDVYAVVLNVVAFVPLGWVGVVLLRWSVPRVVLVLVALSAAVELLQALPGVGRDPSLLDVACNSLGAVIGALTASLVRRRRDGRLAAVADQARVDQSGDERRDVGGDRLGG